MKKILLVGPLPKSNENGGAKYTFINIVNFLKRKNKIKIINIIDTAFESKISSYPKFLLKLGLKFLKYLYRSDIVFLNINVPKGFYLCLILLFITKIFNKKIFIRYFGGDLLRKSRNPINNILLLIQLKFSNKFIVETKNIYSYLSSKNKNIVWFPNSRIMKNKTFHKRNLPKIRKIVYLGEISPRKGIDLLIDLSKIEKIDFEIYLIGHIKGDKNFHERLNNSKLKLIGEIKNKEVDEYLSNFDLFIFPSIHVGEGYPGSIIEAMQAGLPVVANNINNISDVVLDNNNGILIESRDIYLYINAINKITENLTKYNNFRKNAFQTGCDFDSEFINKKFFDKVL